MIDCKIAETFSDEKLFETIRKLTTALENMVRDETWLSDNVHDLSLDLRVAVSEAFLRHFRHKHEHLKTFYKPRRAHDELTLEDLGL